MKKGYKAEYQAKKILEKKFSPKNIFKVAIGGITDFFILEPKKRKVLKIIEVKETKKNSWYPGEHDLKQFRILKKISKEHKIPVEYWIKINGQWKIFNLKEVKKFFL
jgi:hypothetical protein